ncbi:MAG: hypothetical protein ACP5I4_10930 [Oceanipulchritudo sp.]
MARTLQSPAKPVEPPLPAPVLTQGEARAMKAFHNGGATRLLIKWAGDPKSRPELLSALGYLPDSAIQQAVASNPSTGLDDLQRLGMIHPEEFLNNPAFLFEECFGDRLPEHLVRQITRLAAYRKAIRNDRKSLGLDPDERTGLVQKYSGTIWARYLSRDPDPLVRTELAKRLRMSVNQEIQDRLLADASVSVREAIAANRRLPAETYLRLADDPDPRVRRILARNPSRNCAGAHWKIMDRGDAGSLLELAVNTAVKGALARKLSEKGFPIRCALAVKKSLDPDTIEALLNYGEKPVKLRIAANPGLIEHCVIRMFPPEDPELTEAVIANPKCPHLYLSSLAHCGNERVQLALVRRGELPALLQLHLAANGSLRVRKALLKRVTSGKHRHHSPIMCKVCETLANDPRKEIRTSILSDPRLGKHFLTEKLRHSGIGERRRLAGNPSMPLRQIMEMALERDKTIALNALCTLLRHAGRSSEILGQFKDPEAVSTFLRIIGFLRSNLNSLNETQWELLLGNRNTPAAVLGDFAGMEDRTAWESLLKRRFRYPFHLLTESEGKDPEIVPLQPPPSLCAMARHVHSRNPYYRGWAALNLPLPSFMKDMLRKDPSPFVQFVMKTKYNHEDPHPD